MGRAELCVVALGGNAIIPKERTGTIEDQRALARASMQQVAEQVAALEAVGVDTLLLVCSFGSLSHAQVCRSLELFADAVIR